MFVSFQDFGPLTYESEGCLKLLKFADFDTRQQEEEKRHEAQEEEMRRRSRARRKSRRSRKYWDMTTRSRRSRRVCKSTNMKSRSRRGKAEGEGMGSWALPTRTEVVQDYQSIIHIAWVFGFDKNCIEKMENLKRQFLPD